MSRAIVGVPRSKAARDLALYSMDDVGRFDTSAVDRYFRDGGDDEQDALVAIAESLQNDVWSGPPKDLSVAQNAYLRDTLGDSDYLDELGSWADVGNAFKTQVNQTAAQLAASHPVGTEIGKSFAGAFGKGLVTKLGMSSAPSVTSTGAYAKDEARKRTRTKRLLMVGGGLALAGIIYLATRKRS